MVTYKQLRIQFSQHIELLISQCKKKKLTILAIITLLIITFIAIAPQKFIDLWLTRDQQGQILFNQGQYQQASKTFVDTRWRAYSNYGNEDFKSAATLYSQFSNQEDLLAQGNAFAHGREYIKARDLYQYTVHKYPEFKSAKTNLAIVQALIDDINRLSDSQLDEGESSEDLGDQPQTADGAQRKDGKEQEVIQLTSEQLLLDDKLNDMWLRQVQKNPARFLSQKFYMQLDRRNETQRKKNEEVSDD